MKGLVSFSLWGQDLRYINGFKENIRLVEYYYPGWDIVVYMGEVGTFLGDIGEYKVIYTGTAEKTYKQLFNRMLACNNQDYDYVIVRDTDSRINKREAAAVREWIDSGYGFHIMRDHKHHGAKIQGGMFGVVPATYGPLFAPEIMRKYNTGRTNRDTPLGMNWGVDQEYLRDVVWPVIREDHLAHDDWRRITGKEKKFKVSLGKNFVGQRYTYNNLPEYE